MPAIGLPPVPAPSFPSSHRLWRTTLALLPFLLPLLAGCAASKGKGAPLAVSIQELAPHHDRDHFVYLVERPGPDGFRPSSLQVEHVTRLEHPEDFEVALSEDGMPTGRVHMRDDGQTLWLLSEDDFARGVRMSYEPPLAYFRVPLFPGESLSEGEVRIRRLADGQAVGTMRIVHRVKASAAGPGQWLSGAYTGGVHLRMERSLSGTDGNIDLASTTVLVPGIGDVRSEGSLGGEVALRRTLACALVGNRSIGDCRVVFSSQR